jgi:hypothetical protein
MQKTLEQFQTVVAKCREVFLKKTRDYGTSWRILRPSSLTDQLFIKAARIRSIEEKGNQKVSDSAESEYIGLVNYSVLAIMQEKIAAGQPLDLPLLVAQDLYDQELSITIELMKAKNHDYDEAWRDMRISSFTDLILMKILRIKQIEDNDGKTLISEGVEANYRDIINYAIFALIKLDEAKHPA